MVFNAKNETLKVDKKVSHFYFTAVFPNLFLPNGPFSDKQISIDAYHP